MATKLACIGSPGSPIIQTETLPIDTTALRSPGHPFYRRLNAILSEHGFDEHVQPPCAKFYAGKPGRPSVRPGVYFRMLLIG